MRSGNLRIDKGEQVWVLGLDVAPEGLDLGLVGRGVGTAEALADGEQGDEGPALDRTPLGSVIGNGEQGTGTAMSSRSTSSKAPRRHSSRPAALRLRGRLRNTTLTWVPVASAHRRLATHLGTPYRSGPPMPPAGLVLKLR